MFGALWWQVLYKTAKVFAQRGGLEKCAENCEVIREEVEGFKKFVPLVQVGGGRGGRQAGSGEGRAAGTAGKVWSGRGALRARRRVAVYGPHSHANAAPAAPVQALRNPGMRDRHWQQLSAQLGFRLFPDKHFTLAAAEGMGLLGHLPAITRVADVAGKEYSIEVALDKMAREWEAAEMGVVDYRETRTHVIRVEEAVMQMLDDHIAMTQSMAFRCAGLLGGSRAPDAQR